MFLELSVIYIHLINLAVSIEGKESMYQNLFLQFNPYMFNKLSSELIYNNLLILDEEIFLTKSLNEYSRIYLDKYF